MGYRRFAVSIVTTAAFVSAQIPTVAFAQNSAQAEVLFKEGQQLIAQQKYAEACQRLVASYKLDPQPNTELLEGLCFGKQGKTASAYNAFIDAASTLPKGGDAQKYAADQARTLETQLLKVRVQFAAGAPPGMQMHFDDESKPRDKDFLGIDIALDPGAHDLFVTAPGKHDYTKHFDLSASNSPETINVEMTDKTKEELAAEQPKTGGGQVIIEKPETSWSTVKTLGLISMIVGGVGLALGGIFWGVDISNITTAGTGNPNECQFRPNPTQCNDALTAAKTLDIPVAIAGTVAGGAFLVGGIILFVVGGNVTKTPEKAQAKMHVLPWLGPQTAGMTLVGTF
ncbi:MAG TPA: hypothetical protein VGH28_24685 [Polyangiaceae bacterium]